MRRITSPKQLGFKLYQSNNFLSLLLYFLCLSLSPGFYQWSSPSHFQFGTAWLELIFSQILWIFLIVCPLTTSLVFFWLKSTLCTQRLSFSFQPHSSLKNKTNCYPISGLLPARLPPLISSLYPLFHSNLASDSLVTFSLSFTSYASYVLIFIIRLKK